LGRDRFRQVGRPGADLRPRRQRGGFGSLPFLVRGRVPEARAASSPRRFPVSNPYEDDEAIPPPWSGEFELAQLLQHPNARVRALARYLREALGWTTRDTFTGEYVSHLCGYVYRLADGTFDLSRIQPGAGEGWDGSLAWERYYQGRGPAPHRILYVESRRAVPPRLRDPEAPGGRPHAV